MGKVRCRILHCVQYDGSGPFVKGAGTITLREAKSPALQINYGVDSYRRGMNRNVLLLFGEVPPDKPDIVSIIHHLMLTLLRSLVVSKPPLGCVLYPWHLRLSSGRR